MSQQGAALLVVDPSAPQPKGPSIEAKDGLERVKRLARRTGVSGPERHADFSELNRVFGLVEPEIRPLFHCGDAAIVACLERRLDEARAMQ